MQPGSDISKFENKRILIVGDIILDTFTYTMSDRNSPERKEIPVLSIRESRHYLGGAANVALNIKKLKAIPYLVGTVGKDEAGEIIYKLLHQEDITNLYVHTNQRQKTTHKNRLFKNGNPVCRIDEDAVITDRELVNHFLLKNIQDAITNHKPHVLILQDYNKGVLNAAIIPEILALAKQHNMLVCVDPKFDHWELYQDADLFKPNLNEFKAMSNLSNVGEEDLEQAAIALHQKIRFKNLLVTLGAEGNFIFDGNHSAFNRQDSALENPDVCGAGDTVIAVAALALACGFPLKEMAVLSNRAGFIVCQKEHVQPITADELL